MVRHVHIDVLRARAAQMAEKLGKGPDDHLLITEKLAEAHASVGMRVLRPEGEPGILKHYKPNGLARATTIPVRRFNGHLATAGFEDTVQV